MANDVPNFDPLAPAYYRQDVSGDLPLEEQKGMYAISIPAFIETGLYHRHLHLDPVTYDPAGEDAALDTELRSMASTVARRVTELQTLVAQHCTGEDEHTITPSLLSEELQQLRENQPERFGRMFQMALILNKDDWKSKDRIKWEDHLSAYVSLVADDRWGPYQKNDLTTGSLSAALRSNGIDNDNPDISAPVENNAWECELQSLTEGIMMHYVEQALLQEGSDSWKHPHPYYYVAGVKQDSYHFEGNEPYTHALLFGPTGGAFETTTKSYGFTRRYTADAESEPLSLQSILENPGKGFHMETRKAYKGNALEGDIFAVDQGDDLSTQPLNRDISIKDSPYMAFFPYQAELLAQHDSSTALPDDRRLHILSARIRHLKKTELFHEKGTFLDTVRTALEDGITSDELAMLREMVDNADEIYQPDSFSFGVRTRNDNFVLNAVSDDLVLGFRETNDAEGSPTYVRLSEIVSEEAEPTEIRPLPTPEAPKQHDEMRCTAPK